MAGVASAASGCSSAQFDRWEIGGYRTEERHKSKEKQGTGRVGEKFAVPGSWVVAAVVAAGDYYAAVAGTQHSSGIVD